MFIVISWLDDLFLYEANTIISVLSEFNFSKFVCIQIKISFRHISTRRNVSVLERSSIGLKEI